MEVAHLHLEHLLLESGLLSNLPVEVGHVATEDGLEEGVFHGLALILLFEHLVDWLAAGNEVLDCDLRCLVPVW